VLTVSFLLETVTLIALIGVWAAFFHLVGFGRLVAYTCASAAAPATVSFLHSILLLLGIPATPGLVAVLSVGLPSAAIVFVAQRSNSTVWSGVRIAGCYVAPALLGASAMSRVVRFERATPDTLLYIAHARLLGDKSSVFLDSADLSERGLGVSSYHSLASLFDRQLFASMQLNVGVASCCAIFACSWRLISKNQPRHIAGLVSSAGTLFIAVTDRFIFSHQLVNQHGLVGLQLGAVLLLSITLDDASLRLRGAAIASLALVASSIVSARPEGVLSVTYLLFLVATSGLVSLGKRARDLPMLVCCLVLLSLPWAAVLWLHGPRGQAIGTLLIGFGTLAAGPVRRRLFKVDEVDRTTARRLATRSAIALYLSGVLLLCLLDSQRDLGLLTRSIGAIATNFISNGAWGVTVMLVVLLFAVPDRYLTELTRLLKDALLGSTAVLLGLAVIRQGEYRVGAGDSFNRIMYHYLPITGVFLALYLSSLLAARAPTKPTAASE
jgi:hypothetical protein